MSNPPPPGWPQPPPPPGWPQPPGWLQPPGWPPPPAPPGWPQPSPWPGWRASAPPPRRSRAGLVVGIVVGVLVLLVEAGVAVRYGLTRVVTVESASAVSTLPSARPTGPAGPAGETFDLAVGDAVEVRAGVHEWVVLLRAVTWFDGGCGDVAEVDEPVVVAQIELSVLDGLVSLSPIFDFAYIDDGGDRIAPTGLTGCDEPRLDDTLSVPDGGIRTGTIAFMVPSGRGGELFYRRAPNQLTGSWLIPGP